MISFVFVLIFVVPLIACGSPLEQGACTRRIRFEYDATLGWFGEVSAKATTYDSYSDYLAAYREPLERWQALEPTTTCDAALIDLMVDYLTINPDDDGFKDVAEKIMFFDLDIAHTGR